MSSVANHFVCFPDYFSLIRLFLLPAVFPRGFGSYTLKFCSFSELWQMYTIHSSKILKLISNFTLLLGITSNNSHFWYTHYWDTFSLFHLWVPASSCWWLFNSWVQFWFSPEEISARPSALPSWTESLFCVCVCSFKVFIQILIILIYPHSAFSRVILLCNFDHTVGKWKL